MVNPKIYRAYYDFHTACMTYFTVYCMWQCTQINYLKICANTFYVEMYLNLFHACFLMFYVSQNLIEMGTVVAR